MCESYYNGDSCLILSNNGKDHMVDYKFDEIIKRVWKLNSVQRNHIEQLGVLYFEGSKQEQEEIIETAKEILFPETIGGIVPL